MERHYSRWDEKEIDRPRFASIALTLYHFALVQDKVLLLEAAQVTALLRLSTTQVWNLGQRTMQKYPVSAPP